MNKITSFMFILLLAIGAYAPANAENYTANKPQEEQERGPHNGNYSVTMIFL